MRFLCMLAAAGVDVVATVRTLTAAVDGRLVGHVYSVPDLRGAGGRM